MDRSGLEGYILENYGIAPERPWEDEPEYEVFRHPGNQKWFAVVLVVPKNKLGLPGDEILQIVNLKCGPILTGTLPGNPGFFRSWHMNKTYWITAALDGTADEEMLKSLIDLSFQATMPKAKRKRAKD